MTAARSGATFLDAVALHRAGRLESARAIYANVLDADPRQADALHMLGLLTEESGDAGEALALVERSIAVRPQNPRAQYDLGRLRDQRGDRDGAIASYEAALTLVPQSADALRRLADLYLAAGRREDALRTLTSAIRSEPDFAPTHVNIGALLIDLERFDDAIAYLDQAVRLAPELAEAHANLGQAYRRSGRYSEAVRATERAIALRPDDRDAYLNLAAAAYEIDAFETAFAASRRALELDASSAESHYNFALLCHATGRFAEAISANEAAVARDPSSADAHANLALSRLLCGDFAGGWAEYAWTWRLPAKRSSYPYVERAAVWDGEPFAGRELLITREQGFGDAIQIARFLPAIKARGGRVVLEAATPLIALFTGLPGVDELRRAENGMALRDDVDLHIPLLGIPRALGVELASLPGPVPYLTADRERVESWRPRLERAAGLRVGILWAGNAEQANDRRRSTRLAEFADLGAVDGIAWFGLQKGRDEDRRSCGPLEIDPLGAEIADFADSAAILTQLDLVITVDTAVAHLAGALGVPVWTLLSFGSDWRWLIDRPDSPWYPTMRLFRQPRPGDWPAVVNAVTIALREWVRSQRDDRSNRAHLSGR